MKIIEELQKDQLNKKLPQVNIGDTLKISQKIKEGTRERVQAFTGILIARSGKGSTETITLRRISFGEGVEKILPLHSPLISKIEIIQRGKVRKAKLYYLRDLIGKKARVQELKEDRVKTSKKQSKKETEAKVEAAKPESVTAPTVESTSGAKVLEKKEEVKKPQAKPASAAKAEKKETKETAEVPKEEKK